MDLDHFIIVHHNGWNLGMHGDFSSHYLVFDTFKDAWCIGFIWNRWVREGR